MRITICHLSDIHFAVDGNTILEKQEKLCNAILQDALKKEVIIFIVSGDIAQSGQAKEYEIVYKNNLKNWMGNYKLGCLLKNSCFVLR